MYVIFNTRHINTSLLTFRTQENSEKTFCWPYNCNDEPREKENDDYGESDIIIYTPYVVQIMKEHFYNTSNIMVICLNKSTTKKEALIKKLLYLFVFTSTINIRLWMIIRKILK